jgi:hypothetical protein
MRARATNRGRAAGTRCSMTRRVGRRTPFPYVRSMCEELEHCEFVFLFVSESGPVEAPPISMAETVLLVVTALQPLYTATS